MTIVHVINRLVPGGAEKQLMEVAARSRFPAEIVEFEAESKWLSGAALRTLRSRLRSGDVRVVVAWLDRSQIATALAAKRGQRLVAAMQGLPRRTGVAAWQIRLAHTRFHRFVANSEAGRAANIRFARPFSLRPFDVIPNGVTVPTAARAQPGRGIARIGFIGRNDQAKGLDLLVDAVNGLDNRLAGPFEVIFIGEGVPEGVASMGVACRHEAHPRVAEPWEQLGPVDALAVPSRSEGSPNIVLEAFARHVPVVAAAAGGIPELCADDRALVRAVGDADGLRDALVAVLNDREAAARRADRAFAYVLEVHGWDRVVDAWDRLLTEELGRCE